MIWKLYKKRCCLWRSYNSPSALSNRLHVQHKQTASIWALLIQLHANATATLSIQVNKSYCWYCLKNINILITNINKNFFSKEPTVKKPLTTAVISQLNAAQPWHLISVFFQACQNGFSFDVATCACKCGTGFTGTLCQSYNCATSPVPDSSVVCPLVACGDPATNAACPFKCLCGGTLSP